MVVSWLGINRTYFTKSLKQSACHKSPCQDDAILQTLTDDVLIFDSGSDKNTNIEC